jgi:alkylhydroperoxidase family enzyme
VSGPLRATLAFLEKLIPTPSEVTAADIQALRRAGVGPEDIRDAVYIALQLSVSVRLADALGFTVPSPKSLDGHVPGFDWNS